MMKKDGQGEFANHSATACRALNIECLLNIFSYRSNMTLIFSTYHLRASINRFVKCCRAESTAAGEQQPSLSLTFSLRIGHSRNILLGFSVLPPAHELPFTKRLQAGFASKGATSATLSFLALSLDRSIILTEMSTPTTRQPCLFARKQAVTPAPQPTSNMY